MLLANSTNSNNNITAGELSLSRSPAKIQPAAGLPPPASISSNSKEGKGLRPRQLRPWQPGLGPATNSSSKAAGLHLGQGSPPHDGGSPPPPSTLGGVPTLRDLQTHTSGSTPSFSCSWVQFTALVHQQPWVPQQIRPPLTGHQPPWAPIPRSISTNLSPHQGSLGRGLPTTDSHIQSEGPTATILDLLWADLKSSQLTPGLASSIGHLSSSPDRRGYQGSAMAGALSSMGRGLWVWF